jgi:hypothetical protein
MIDYTKNQKLFYNKLKMRLNFRYQIQRKLRSVVFRDFFTQLSVYFKPKKNIKLSSEEHIHLSNLNELGWTSVGEVLTIKDVDKLTKKLSDFPLTDRFRPELGEFSIENVPKNSHVASYLIENWNLFPEIIALANSDQFLKIAERYLGCVPTISNLQIWWSFPGHESAEDSENFHRDVDDWKFLKLFVYLTDVDEENGPHVYVQKSLKKHRTLEIRRYTDLEVESLFKKEDIIQMLGKKGEGLMEDTFGFHKGQLAKSKRRLLLQIQYSINPIAIAEYPTNMSDLNHDPYVNRLYLKIGNNQ